MALDNPANPVPSLDRRPVVDKFHFVFPFFPLDTSGDSFLRSLKVVLFSISANTSHRHTGTRTR
jgi:hypothetical protein